MGEHPIKGLMDSTLEKIKQMVDVNTIIGTPITSPDGTVIIPVSKVSYGFASGGSDLPTKTESDCFAGGGGAGISISPIAFIAIRNGEVKMMQIATSSTTADKVVNIMPDLIDKVADLFKKDKNKSADQA